MVSDGATLPPILALSIGGRMTKRLISGFSSYGKMSGFGYSCCGEVCEELS